jgi:hypothetical protein
VAGEEGEAKVVVGPAQVDTKRRAFIGKIPHRKKGKDLIYFFDTLTRRLRIFVSSSTDKHERGFEIVCVLSSLSCVHDSCLEKKNHASSFCFCRGDGLTQAPSITQKEKEPQSSGASYPCSCACPPTQLTHSSYKHVVSRREQASATWHSLLGERHALR